MSSIAKKPKILKFGDHEVEVWLRRNRRSRHMILSLDAADGVFRLTLPRGTTVDEGLRFAAQKRRWMLARLGELPPRVPFAPGAVVPFLGQPHRIVHEPLARRGVWRETGTIHACGLAEHVARRVEDHLKREARAILLPRVREKARQVDRPLARVGLRDPRTRWGSCSSDGTISLSWRLILAPEEVLDYVVAHEVAHLVHQDHSPAFWRLVRDLTPDVTGPQRWLKTQGATLHRYGSGGRKTWPEDLAGRPGRKIWRDDLAGRRVRARNADAGVWRPLRIDYEPPARLKNAMK